MADQNKCSSAACCGGACGERQTKTPWFALVLVTVMALVLVIDLAA